MTTLTVTPMSPLIASEPAVLSATAVGGTGPYAYQFWVYDSLGSSWTVQQAWSPSSTFVWWPPNPRPYWVQVWVRNAGSTSSYDAWAGLGPLSVLP